MQINNKYNLWDSVSLPWDSKNYVVYKISVQHWNVIEYLLWDLVNDYPWWYSEWQIEPLKEDVWFKYDN